VRQQAFHWLFPNRYVARVLRELTAWWSFDLRAGVTPAAYAIPVSLA